VVGQLTASRRGVGEHRTHAAIHRAIPKAHENRAHGYDGVVTVSARTLSRHSGEVSSQAAVRGAAKGIQSGGRAAEDGARLASRTDQLTGALDPIAQNSRTSAVMSTRQGADVLAGGGRDLSPAQRALSGGDDVLGRLPGAHAEITAMDAAGKAGLTPWQMAVSRPICPACQSAIEGSGGTVAPGGMFAWWPW
jgi:tRNA(Arg) A34 adenosine deaminase TadA